MKSNKKNILIIVLVVLFLGLVVFFITYEFNNELYIKLNRKNLQIDRYKIGDKAIAADDLITDSSNIIESNLDKKIYTYFTISINGTGDAKFIKNGSALVEYYVQDNSLVLEIISLYSVDEGDYTSKLDQRKYIMNFTDEKIKNFIYGDPYLYILTESDNVYRYRMNELTDTIAFEHCLLNFNKNYSEKINKLDVHYGEGKDVFTNFKAKELVKYRKKIYALTNDNKYMLLSSRDYENLEYNFIDKHSTFRFYNSLLIFNNKSNARLCTDYEEQRCNDSNTYDLIKNDSGNDITISAVIDGRGEEKNLYIMDTSGNLYIKNYNYEEDNYNIFANGISKYKKNKVVEIVYLYKDTEPYMLEDVLILFDNGTRMKLGKDFSRLNILINEKSKL